MGDPSWFEFLQNLRSLGDLASDPWKLILLTVYVVARQSPKVPYLSLNLFAYPSLNNPGPPVPSTMRTAHISESPHPSRFSCSRLPYTPGSPRPGQDISVWKYRSKCEPGGAHGETSTSSRDPGPQAGEWAGRGAGAPDVGNKGMQLHLCFPSPPRRGLFPPDPALTRTGLGRGQEGHQQQE